MQTRNVNFDRVFHNNCGFSTAIRQKQGVLPLDAFAHGDNIWPMASLTGMCSPTLLCVDDRQEFLQLRKTSLEPLGYSVATATSTSAAIAILERMAVAAVLVEYKSEGMDAQAVAHHIRQRFPTQPIILLSGYSDMPEPILWLVDEYVMRSESVEGLVQVIERVTGRSRKVAPRPTGITHAYGRTA